MTVTTFSELELDESLLEALQDKGFTRPTAIQAAAIPPALDGRTGFLTREIEQVLQRWQQIRRRFTA